MHLRKSISSYPDCIIYTTLLFLFTTLHCKETSMAWIALRLSSYGACIISGNIFQIFQGVGKAILPWTLNGGEQDIEQTLMCPGNCIKKRWSKGSFITWRRQQHLSSLMNIIEQSCNFVVDILLIFLSLWRDSFDEPHTVNCDCYCWQPSWFLQCKKEPIVLNY